MQNLYSNFQPPVRKKLRLSTGASTKDVDREETGEDSVEKLIKSDDVKLGVETEDKEEVQGQDLENQEVSCIESENAGLKDSRGDCANDFEG